MYAYAEDRREMIIREAEALSSDAVHCASRKVMEDFGLSHNLMMLDIVIADNVEASLMSLQSHNTALN